MCDNNKCEYFPNNSREVRKELVSLLGTPSETEVLPPRLDEILSLLSRRLVNCPRTLEVLNLHLSLIVNDLGLPSQISMALMMKFKDLFEEKVTV